MKRQVILIMTDTTRKDMLGCYGNKDMKTWTDWLSGESVMRMPTPASLSAVLPEARSLPERFPTPTAW